MTGAFGPAEANVVERPGSRQLVYNLQEEIGDAD